MTACLSTPLHSYAIRTSAASPSLSLFLFLSFVFLALVAHGTDLHAIFFPSPLYFAVFHLSSWHWETRVAAGSNRRNDSGLPRVKEGKKSRPLELCRNDLFSFFLSFFFFFFFFLQASPSSSTILVSSLFVLPFSYKVRQEVPRSTFVPVFDAIDFVARRSLAENVIGKASCEIGRTRKDVK